MSRLLNASPELLDVLEALMAGYEDYYYPYAYIEDETGIDRKALTKIVGVLKALGYVKYARGLRDEEGQVAGSGFGINHEKRDEIELALKVRELQDTVATTITIGKKKYKLVPIEEVR